MFIIYELGHVDELKKYLERHPEEKISSVVIALSIDIEEKLHRENIFFISAAAYKKAFPDQLSNEDEIMEDFFSHPGWDAFVHRGISLPKIFRFMFRAYLQVVRYYGMLLSKVIEEHPAVRGVKLFPPGEALSSTHGTLAFREIHAVVDCAKRIGEIKGIPVTVLSPSIVAVSIRNSLRPIVFSLKRSIFGILIKTWNAVVIAISRPRAKRFLISDHWRNVESSASLLQDVELIFLDRTEVRHISFRFLLRYRMRFVHIADFLPRGASRRIREDSTKFLHIWKETRDNLPKIFTWTGNSFDQLFLTAIEDIILDFPRILSEIEGAYALYEKVRPNVVALRASVSKQPHFSILPMVAKKLGIPSIELQHGLEYLGPGSWSREHEAEYIAVYGHLVKQELISIGYEEDKLVEIGSPRFDRHIISQKKHEKFTILCIAPDIRAFEVYDSYSAFAYFASISQAAEAEKEHIHIVFKLRPGPADEALLRGIIARVFIHFSYDIAQYESLSELYSEVDMVISGFSTAVIEAMQCGLPVIIPAIHPVDAKIVQFHFSRYSDAGALIVANTPDAFSQALSSIVHDPQRREAMRASIVEFMAKNFCFDGKSSERYATLMKKLA